MKVALVYDRVNKFGGAERVLLSLHKLFPDAPLYSSVYDREKAAWASVFNVKTSFLQNLPFAKTNHEMLAPLMPLAFESFDFGKYDLVISVTSEAAKGIKTSGKTKHLCYMLTPTRYLWSGYDEYFKNNSFKLLSKPIINNLRKWDLNASKRPDRIIAISKEVQKRIKKFYGRDSVVVYPPVPLRHPERSEGSQKKKRDFSLAAQNNNDTGYFLVVSRLSKFTKYKRVDLAVDVFNELKLSLKIIGDGSLKNELKKKAGSNISFVGKVSDRQLTEYYKNCKALVFPGIEDLGLVMIEAQTFGKPVIALSQGGAKELLIDGKSGILFKEQTKESLKNAVLRFGKMKFDPKVCMENAKRFDFTNFEKKFLSVVNKLI